MEGKSPDENTEQGIMPEDINITLTTQDTLPKIGKPLPKLSKKQELIKTQVEAGADLDSTIELAGYSPTSAYTVKSVLLKYLDSNPKMVRKSRRVREKIMDRMLKGDPYYISAAERVSARIQDCLQPVVSKQQIETRSVSVVITPEVSQAMAKKLRRHGLL